MESIVEVLVRRDGMSIAEAKELVMQAIEDLQNRLEDPAAYGDPFEVCADWFGLEPDFLMELF